MALAVRALGRGDDDTAPDPGTVLRIAERVMAEGDCGRGPDAHDLGPADARALLHAWLQSVELEVDSAELIAHIQATGSRTPASSGARAGAMSASSPLPSRSRAPRRRPARRADWNAVAAGVFEACMAAIPYAPAAAFLAREKDRVSVREDETVRVALVADGLGAMHGLTSTVAQIRDRGVPGFEVDVIGTDACVDRRLSAVAESEVPFYPGLTVGVPGLPAVVDALAEGRYGLLHVCSPGPAGVAALLTGRLLGLPVAGSYHTELAAYAALRAGDPLVAAGMRMALAAFYGQCHAVLSPSASADAALCELGVDAGADRALGPRRRPDPLLPNSPLRAARGPRRRVVRRAPDAREGG